MKTCRHINDTEQESLAMWARIDSFVALYLNLLLNLIIFVSVISFVATIVAMWSNNKYLF